jgi:hypothetical protein
VRARCAWGAALATLATLATLASLAPAAGCLEATEGRVGGIAGGPGGDAAGGDAPAGHDAAPPIPERPPPAPPPPPCALAAATGLTRLGGASVFGRGAVNGLAVRDGVAYAAAGDLGLQTFDASDPTRPRPLGWADTPGEAVGVALAGDYAFVADNWSPTGESSGLRVIDVADPEQPALVASLGPMWLVKAVEVVDDVAYVLEFEGSLRLIDVADPLAPEELAAVPLPEGWGLRVEGDRAYVLTSGCGAASEERSIVVLDVSDPAGPVKLGQVETPCYPGGLEVVDARAYVVDYNRFRVFDLSDPAAFREIGSRDGDAGHALRVRDGLAYVIAAERGLRIFDVSAATPQPRGKLALPREGRAVALDGDVAWLGTRVGPDVVLNPTSGGLATAEARLHAVDISDPAKPELLGSYLAPGAARRVAVEAGVAALADMGGGLRLYAIDTPERPRQLAHVRLDGVTRDVALRDGRAAVLVDGGASPAAALVIEDIASPWAPRELGRAFVPGYEGGLTFGPDGRIYVAAEGNFSEDGGLWIFDLDAAGRPLLIGTVALDHYSRTVTVVGATAYVSGIELQVVDVRDPTAPTLTWTSAHLGAVEVAADARYVALGSANYLGRLTILAAGDEAAGPLAELDLGGDIEQIALAGDRLWLANGYRGLRVIDISTPEAPVEVTLFDTPAYAWGLAVAHERLFVADGFGALQVLGATCP